MLLDKFYTIESRDENSAVVRLSDESHPVFKAHFPTSPIMPGFVHFDIIADAFDIEITTIKKAKFLDKVVANETLVYKKNANKFKIFSQDKEIASISL